MYYTRYICYEYKPNRFDAGVSYVLVAFQKRKYYSGLVGATHVPVPPSTTPHPPLLRPTNSTSTWCRGVDVFLNGTRCTYEDRERQATRGSRRAHRSDLRTSSNVQQS